MIRPTILSLPAALFLLLAAPGASAQPEAGPAHTHESEPTTLVHAESEQAPALPPPLPAPADTSTPTTPPATANATVVPQKAAPVAKPETPEQPRPQWGLHASMAVRTNFITSRGFEPFSTSSELPQFELSAGKQLLEVDTLSVGIAAGWANGGSEASLRGTSSSLSLNRLWLAPELRAHVLPRLVVLARIAPGLVHTSTSVKSSDYGYRGYGSSENAPNLEDSGWTWGVDMVGGLSFELFRIGPAAGPTMRFWLDVTGGYSFAGKTDVKLRPSTEDSVDRNFRAVSLPSLSPGGALTNVALSISL